LEIGGIGEPAEIDPAPQHIPGNPEATSAHALRSVGTGWNSVAGCPYVKAEWIESYLSLTDGCYNALYAFMVKVALATTRRGISLTPASLPISVAISNG
jgi:hypothetical protein